MEFVNAVAWLDWVGAFSGGGKGGGGGPTTVFVFRIIHTKYSIIIRNIETFKEKRILRSERRVNLFFGGVNS